MCDLLCVCIRMLWGKLSINPHRPAGEYFKFVRLGFGHLEDPPTASRGRNATPHSPLSWNSALSLSLFVSRSLSLSPSLSRTHARTFSRERRDSRRGKCDQWTPPPPPPLVSWNGRSESGKSDSVNERTWEWSRHGELGALDLDSSDGVGGGTEDRPRQRRRRPDVPLRGAQDPIWDAIPNSTEHRCFLALNATKTQNT